MRSDGVGIVTATMSGVQGMPVRWATREWDKEDWEMQQKAVQTRLDQHKEAAATLSVNSLARLLPKLLKQILATYPEEDPELAFGPIPDLDKIALRWILIDEYNMEWKRYLERYSA